MNKKKSSVKRNKIKNISHSLFLILLIIFNINPLLGQEISDQQVIFGDPTVFTETTMTVTAQISDIVIHACNKGCYLGIRLKIWSSFPQDFVIFKGAEDQQETYPCVTDSDNNLFENQDDGECMSSIVLKDSNNIYLFYKKINGNQAEAQKYSFHFKNVFLSNHINEPKDIVEFVYLSINSDGKYSDVQSKTKISNAIVEYSRSIDENNIDFKMQQGSKNAHPQEQIDAYFQFKTNIPMQGSASRITLVFPEEFKFSSGTFNYNFSTNDPCGYLNTSVQIQEHKLVIGEYSIYEFSEGEITCTLHITNLISPLYVAETSSFKFYIDVLDTNQIYQKSSQIESGITFTPSAGEIQSATLDVDNPTVNTQTKYTFTLELNRTLSENGKIKVIFPIEIQTPSDGTGNCEGSGDSNIKSSIKCTINGQSVLFEEIFTDDFDATYDIILSIADIINPITTKKSSSFQFITYYDDDESHIVDDSTTLTFKSQAGILTDITVTPESLVVGESDVSYDIQFDCTSGMKINGSIEIFFPDTIVSSKTSAGDCKINIQDGANQSVTCIVDRNIPNKITISSVPEILKGKTVTITIQKEFQNPNMKNIYGTYKIYTYSEDVSLIDQIEQGVTSEILTPDKFNQINLKYDNEINAAQNSFTFEFLISVPHSHGDSIVIEFPVLDDGTYSFKQMTTCTAIPVSSNLSGNQLCSISGNKMTITLNFSDQSQDLFKNSMISFTIPNMVNHYSIQPSNDPFSFSTYANLGPTYLRQQEQSVIQLETSQAANLSNVSASPDIDFIGEEATWTFQFELKSHIPNQGKVQIEFPDIFTFNSANFDLINCDYDCALEPLSGYVQKFTGNNFPTSSKIITFAFKGIINPEFSKYQDVKYFRFSTFDQNSKIMDQTEAGQFSITCNQPCRSCSPSDKDHCLSCYTNIPEIPKNLFVISGNECVSNCPIGTVDNLYDQCQDCNSPCKTCGNNSPDHCESCILSYYLDQSNKCVRECEDGFYKDDSISPASCTECDSVSNFCETCNSETECTSCVSPKLYHQDQNICIDDCEAYSNQAMVNDNTNGICLKCNSPCLTCTGTQDDCLTCRASYYYLLIEQKCYRKCPDGYGISGINCELCDTSSHCQTCPDGISICDSCENGYYLIENLNQCVSDCPDGYYLNGLKCDLCEKQCATCTTDKFCLTCNNGYSILFKDFCYMQCPPDFPHYDGETCLSHREACAENCEKCSVTDLVCYECVKPFLLFNDGECLSTCPEEYQPNSENTKCEEKSTYSENFKSYRHIPIPISLMSLPFAFSVYISKIQYPVTYLAGSLVSIMCIFEYIAYIVLMIIFWQNKQDDVKDGEIENVVNSKTLVLIFSCVAINYIWNVISQINFYYFFSKDIKFQEWRNKNKTHKIASFILRLFGLFFTFRIMRFYYSKYFDYSIFQMKLLKLNKLVCLNFITACSVLSINLPMIFAAGTIVYNTTQVDQSFWQALDVIILSLVMVILLIYENKKERTFFQPNKYSQLNQSLNDKKFSDSNISKAYDRYPHGKFMHYMDVKDQDENLEEFKENNKITQIDNIQKPLHEPIVPEQGESMNQAKLAPHMNYQKQEEKCIAGKPRQFTSQRLNPYKKYQVVDVIDEEDEYQNNLKSKLFMDENENENDKQIKLNYSYSEQISDSDSDQCEEGYYDDNFEPDFPIRLNNFNNLTCKRPGNQEMSRGLGFQNQNDQQYTIDDCIENISNFSDLSGDSYLQQPVKFNQLNGITLYSQPNKNLLNTMISENAEANENQEQNQPDSSPLTGTQKNAIKVRRRQINSNLQFSKAILDDRVDTQFSGKNNLSFEKTPVNEKNNILLDSGNRQYNNEEFIYVDIGDVQATEQNKQSEFENKKINAIQESSQEISYSNKELVNKSNKMGEIETPEDNLDETKKKQKSSSQYKKNDSDENLKQKLMDEEQFEQQRKENQNQPNQQSGDPSLKNQQKDKYRINISQNSINDIDQANDSILQIIDLDLSKNKQQNDSYTKSEGLKNSNSNRQKDNLNFQNPLQNMQNFSQISEIQARNDDSHNIQSQKFNQIKNDDKLFNQIIDSDNGKKDDLQSLGDSQIQQNQISPSDFNYLNMRYDSQFIEKNIVQQDSNNMEKSKQQLNSQIQQEINDIQQKVQEQQNINDGQYQNFAKKQQEIIHFSDSDEFDFTNQYQVNSHPQKDLKRKRKSQQIQEENNNNLLNYQSQKTLNERNLKINEDNGLKKLEQIYIGSSGIINNKFNNRNRKKKKNSVKLDFLEDDD